MKKTLNSFYLPVRFRSGEGALRECAGEIAPLGSRCFILTGGSSAKACGALDDLLSTLESAADGIVDGIKSAARLSERIRREIKADVAAVRQRDPAARGDIEVLML